jgi:hypothetical protein
VRITWTSRPLALHAVPTARAHLSYPVFVKSLLWLRQVADLLDSRFRIPGTRIRFGLDPILALLPGIGSLASPLFTVALLAQAVYQRVPRVIMLRMLVNALLDALIGAVPVAGAVGDLFYRANLRNLALLERHARPGVAPTRGDRTFVLAAAAVFGLVILVPVVLALWLAVLLWNMVAR